MSQTYRGGFMKIALIAIALLIGQVSYAANDCIRTHAIRNFHAINEYTVEINAGRDRYLMDVSFCSELPWAHRIGFDSFSGSRVCRGDRLLVLDNFSNHIKQRCYIHGIKKISNI